MRTRKAVCALLLALAASASLVAQSAQELYQRGLVAEQANGDLASAIALYTQAAKTSGRDRGLAARALMRVAGAHEKLGQRADAASAYAEVARAYPEQRAEVAVAQERLAVLRAASSGQARATGALDPRDGLSAARPMLDRYCVSCHNDANATAGLNLQVLRQAPVRENTAQWERVTRRLQARLDPPAGAARADDATYRAVVSGLQQTLDAAYAADRATVPIERVADGELAARMAMFLWNTVPDSELNEAARRGELRDSAGLNRQVVRMLRNPKSDGLVDGLLAGWLSLDRLRRAQPDATVFPQFDAELRQAMEVETRLFLQAQLREDRGALELWTANYTYVNDRLARHYGLPGVNGKEFVRVTWPDSTRAGVLGQASALTGTSQSSRTSPTVRGIYVLTRVLGIDAPNPPANVPALAEPPGRTAQGALRERMTAHKTNPACANCHAVFDPFGLALENFDAIGAWRSADGGSPIDPSGAFIDGTRFNDVGEFRAGLLRYRDAYYDGVTRQLLAYALNRKGRGGRVYDYEMSAVRKIVRDAAATNYRWSSILSGIVASAPFQMKSLVP
jgi:hypothetical protein